jgi:hypothetical protein
VRGIDRNRLLLPALQLHKNIIQYTIQVLQCFIIPVAKHLDTFLLKDSGPVLVICHRVGVVMLPAILLDSQLFLRTIEIKNEFLDRVLPAEFVFSQTPVV